MNHCEICYRPVSSTASRCRPHVWVGKIKDRQKPKKLAPNNYRGSGMTKEELQERNRMIVKLRESGVGFTDIGYRYDIHRVTARTAYLKHKK